VTRTHQDIVAELIAQAVQQVQGAIGVLIRDIPFVAPMPLLGQLRKLEEAGAGLRVAYLAPGGQAAAEAVGFDPAHFSVEVEQAERWRNQRELDATIVVVAAADVAKLSSLQDFEHITSRALKEQLARQVLGAQGSANEVQGRWWRLLRDDERVSLGQLVDYYATLEPLPEADFIVQASREIHRLGLLPDPALFDNPRESAIRRRMQDNRELLGRLQTLTEQDRKIIANNIGNEQDVTQRARLARSLRHLRQLRRGGHGLDRLPLQDAQDLLAIRRPARPQPPTPPAGGSSEPPPPPPPPPPSKQSITEFAADALLADTEEHPEDAPVLQAVVEQAKDHLNQLEEPAARPEPLEIPLDTGIKLHGQAPLDVLNLVSRLIGDGVYGALVQSGSVDVEDMLRRFQSDADVLKRWSREQLTELLANFDHPAARELADRFAAYDQARTAILPLARLLCAEPLAVAAEPRARAALLDFIARYQGLLDHVNMVYPALFDHFRSDADDLVAHFLVLETIAFHTEGGPFVLAAPTHPLYLWHYAEYCRLVDAQRKDLSPRDHKLIKEAAEHLPNFLTSLCLPNIAAEHSSSLPQIGRLGPLPYYGAAPQVNAGDDGAQLVERLVRAFLDAHPPARFGLRFTLVDPPDAGAYLRLLCDLADAEPPLTGAHLTVLRHPQRKRGVELRLTADEEDRVARIFQATADERRFTLDVRNLTTSPATIPTDVLSHVVVTFDQAEGMPRRAATVAHPIQPLVMRRRLRYRVQAKTVDLEPEAGGIFDAYNKVVAHFDQSAQTSYFAIHQQQATRANLAAIAATAPWCVIADRQVDRDLRLGRLRIFTGREGDRDVAAFATSTDPFRRALRQVAQQYNTSISDEQLDALLDELSELLDGGVLSLRPDSAGKVDHARVKGMLGTLIAARWYRSTPPEGHHRLLISLDDADARRWLHLRDDALRADLVGFESGNEHFTITIFEVKAVQNPAAEFDIKEGIVTGPAVEQMLSTRRLLAAVFASDRDNELITTPARREILREHVFRELTKPSYSPDARRTWVPVLERLFEGSATAELRCQLIDIRLGTDLASLSQPREVRALDGDQSVAVTIRELNEAGIDALQQQQPSEGEPEQEPLCPDTTSAVPPDSTSGEPPVEAPTATPVTPGTTTRQPTTGAAAPSEPVAPARPRAYLGEGPGSYGRSREVWFDPELPGRALPNPHISITGETGSGKTQATKALLRELGQQGVPILVLDFKDDYSQPDYTDAEGLTTHDASLGGLPFNPMIPPVDPQSGHASPMSHIYQLVGIVRRIYKLGDQQAYRLREALKEVYEIQGVGTKPFMPTEDQMYLPFESVNDVLRRSKENEALLGRLSTIFDLNLFASSQEEIAFAELVSDSTVIRLSQLPGDEVKNAVAEFFLMALHTHLLRLTHPHALRRLLVLDEAWRLVQSPFLEPLMREGRAFGLGVIVATQFPKDLPDAVAGNTATRLFFSQAGSDNIREIQRTIIGKTSGADAEHLAAIVRQMPPLTCLVQSSQYMPYIRTAVVPYFERVAGAEG
jgi:hypothetical protein